MLQDSPSINPYLEEVLAECYRRGKKLASNETGISQNAFPSDLPYSMTQILDMEFLP